MTRLVTTLATWFGTGLSPIAPGTVGTMGAIPLYLLLAPLPLPLYLAVTLAVTLLACWAAGRAQVIYNASDPGKIVIDEVAGYLVTMAASGPPTILTVTAGFLLFRIFDILKPFPARQVDRRMKNGCGVVLDDIVAGIYAWGSLQLLGRLL
jgi:phosphatidylglycerophosphatase A